MFNIKAPFTLNGNFKHKIQLVPYELSDSKILYLCNYQADLGLIINSYIFKVGKLFTNYNSL